MSSTANALAAAQKKLAEAKDFSKQVTGKEMADPPKKPAAKPAAKPSVSIASPSDNSSDAAALTAGLKARMDEAPKFHKGGKIKKDGKQMIDAQAGETVLPNHDPKRAMELAMDHVKGMADGMKKEEKEKSHKVKPMHEHGKRHGKLKAMHHTRNTDGSWHIRHEYEPQEDGSQTPDTTHGAQDGDSLVSHVIQHAVEPNQGEPEADAGQHGVPAAQAEPAGLPMPGGQGA